MELWPMAKLVLKQSVKAHGLLVTSSRNKDPVLQDKHPDGYCVKRPKNEYLIFISRISYLTSCFITCHECCILFWQYLPILPYRPLDGQYWVLFHHRKAKLVIRGVFENTCIVL